MGKCIHRKSLLSCMTILLIICTLKTSNSFLTPQVKTFHASKQISTKLHIFERMSEDCISALMISQEESSNYNNEFVTSDLLLLGIASSPQNARVTLKKYGITSTKIKSHIKSSSGSDSSPNSQFEGLFLNKKSRDVELPFAPNVKRVLSNANQLSLSFTAESIQSEHLLLSIMGYDKKSNECNPVNEDVLFFENMMDDDFVYTEFCRQLLLDMKNEQNQKELVTSGGGGSGSEKERKTPLLEEYGIDLTQSAKENSLDPVHGRDVEIIQCIRTLLRRRKNNPVLVGEAGVGKTALVEGLAQILVAADVLEELELVSENAHDKKEKLQTLANLCPIKLRNHRIISLEVSNLVAGTKYRGEFEERIQGIIQELSESTKPTILFLDEIHTLVNSGSAEGGGIDAANILKPALSRSKIQVIGATTIAEYRKYIEKDAALERRFQPLYLSEPDYEQTLRILQELAPEYESYHGVKYTPECLKAAYVFADRYINDRFFPDKAIDLIDDAGAALSSAINDEEQGDAPIVTEDILANVISELTKIPISKIMDENELSKVLTLESTLSSRVIGQSYAVNAVCRAIRRSRSGLRDLKRPIASFLFCGSTGVGKTELCKVLADTYYNSPKNFIRIDMSEYMEKHSVSRLTGPPPGYIGYEDGGTLTNAVRSHPHSVILLDELEKAHMDVTNILLQILDDGILTDGKGRTIHFKNVILVMTSNVGSSKILNIANDAKEDDDINDIYAQMSNVVKEELEYNFKPEFINRIDEVVTFTPLQTKDLSNIAQLLLNATIARARNERNIDFTYSDTFLDIVLDHGTSASMTYGARPMRRSIQRYFEDTVSDAILNGFLKDGDHAFVDVVDSLIGIRRERDGEMYLVSVDTTVGLMPSDSKVNGSDGGGTMMVNGDSESVLSVDPSLN